MKLRKEHWSTAWTTSQWDTGSKTGREMIDWTALELRYSSLLKPSSFITASQYEKLLWKGVQPKLPPYQEKHGSRLKSKQKVKMKTVGKE